MPLLFNLRHLENQSLHLKDELPVEEMDLDPLDELIHLDQPLFYDLQLEKLEKGVLVQGTLRLTLQCECARCLKPYQYDLALERWTCHLALEGEEKVVVVNDCVDLTPYIREDILLAFPQHPLCEPGCKGLASPIKDLGTGGERESNLTSSAWAELNKLKF
jgi:uncharacterized protein